MVMTLPPLIYQVLKLTPEFQKRELNPDPSMPVQTTTKKALQFVHKTVTAVQQCVNDAGASPELPFRLWLHSAKVASDCEQRMPGNGCEPICVEFLSQALICFEEEMSDSRVQFNAICAFISSLSQMVGLEEENYINLATKSVQFAAQKLLKKADQCRAIAHASGAFWSPVHKDGRRVLECLQKCVKLADACVQTQSSNIGLFVEVLDMYIMMYEKDNPEFSSAFIGNLLSLISEHVNYAENSKELAAAKVHVRNVIKHIKLEQAGEKKRYSDLDLSKYT